VFVFYVCTVTEFSAEDKASGVKFCTTVHRRPRQGISHFYELCSPEAQNRTNRPARHHLYDVHDDYHLAPEQIARYVDVGSAYVDIRQSPEMDVLVFSPRESEGGVFTGVRVCVCVCLSVCDHDS